MAYRFRTLETVRYGHFKEYYENWEKMAKVASDRSWGQPRVIAPVAGNNNEVVYEWDFASLEEMATTQHSWQTDKEMMDLYRIAGGLVIEGSSRSELYEDIYAIA